MDSLFDCSAPPRGDIVKPSPRATRLSPLDRQDGAVQDEDPKTESRMGGFIIGTVVPDRSDRL